MGSGTELGTSNRRGKEMIARKGVVIRIVREGNRG